MHDLCRILYEHLQYTFLLGSRPHCTCIPGRCVVLVFDIYCSLSFTHYRHQWHLLGPSSILRLLYSIFSEKKKHQLNIEVIEWLVFCSKFGILSKIFKSYVKKMKNGINDSRNMHVYLMYKEILQSIFKLLLYRRYYFFISCEKNTSTEKWN